jgi:hypothetical protein
LCHVAFIYIGSFQLICQELRGLALAKTMLPKGGSKIDVDAANSLDVPQDELKAVLGEVACDIHGCFVLKSSKDDLFRFSLSLSLSLSLSRNVCFNGLVALTCFIPIMPFFDSSFI